MARYMGDRSSRASLRRIGPGSSGAVLAALVALLGATAVPVQALVPTATPPGPPTSVTVAAGQGSATVTWRPPASDGGSPITIYVATATPTASGASPRSCTTTGATTCMIGDLSAGGIYQVTVVAGNPSLGASSTPVALTPIGNAAPQAAITSVTPKRLSPNGGTRVTIRGANLAGATRVVIGGVRATKFVVISPTAIAVTAPRGRPGPTTLSVTTPFGTVTSTALSYRRG